MTMTERATIVGVFASRPQADSAINDLRKLGFADDQIGYVVREAGTIEGNVTPGASHEGEHAAAAAVGGGVLGGLLGAAASLFIPGFGPVVAGGILIATLGGAAIGAAAGGMIGAFTDMGVPEEEARYYQGQFEAGSMIVTVRAPGRQGEVVEIFKRNGATNTGTGASTNETAAATVQPGTLNSPDNTAYAQPGTYNNTAYTQSGTPEANLTAQPERVVPAQSETFNQAGANTPPDVYHTAETSTETTENA